MAAEIMIILKTGTLAGAFNSMLFFRVVTVCRTSNLARVRTTAPVGANPKGSCGQQPYTGTLQIHFSVWVCGDMLYAYGLR